MNDNIYPCFACEQEFLNFNDVEAHISTTHGEEVKKDTAKVFDYLNRKYQRLEMQQVYFIPARFLSNKKENKIIAGYDDETGYYFIEAQPDVLVKDLQTLSGYLVLGKKDKDFILAKKR